MLHHLSLPAVNLARATIFYDAVLGALGYARVFTAGDAAGYGYPGQEDLLLFKRADSVTIPDHGFHLAFAAARRDHVVRFHDAALGNGGRCNGPPGLRPHYGDDYYAAFVIDREGYRIEAVCTRRN